MKYDILQEPKFSEHLSRRILDIYKESWKMVYPDKTYEDLDKSLLDYACSRVEQEVVDYCTSEMKKYLKDNKP